MNTAATFIRLRGTDFWERLDETERKTEETEEM